MITDTTRSQAARLWGIPTADVSWTDGIYKERLETCAEATVPHLQKMFESPQISHVVENFRIAAGLAEGDFDGTVFGDGDFYKWMEAAVYTAVKTGNQQLMDQLDAYVELIESAQQPDGYLSTKQIIGERTGKASRLGDINDFEVYNFGHMFTSACVYYRATGKDRFLKVAARTADYLKNLFTIAKETGKVQTAVCPSHYMGIAEMYRTTGDPKYLELLKLAIDVRDLVAHGLDDNQDRDPLRSHRKIIGHAVRANYLYAGVADLCLEAPDEELMTVLNSVWRSLVDTKLYIHGGCGALYNGASPYGLFFDHQLTHQAYGYEYQLPNVTAYSETCASVGGIYWAWRMLMLNKNAEYADVLERMLLNVCLAGVSLNGTEFFYENMLRRAHKLPYELIWGQERAQYILSYCCPPNVARLIAQTSEYAYAQDEEGIYTVLYGANQASFTMNDGSRMKLRQETEYPYSGKIRFVIETPAAASWKLNVRIPGWVRKGSAAIGDTEVLSLSRKVAKSYQTLEIPAGFTGEILLDLGMEPRLTQAHTLVEESLGQLAVEMGPMLYCVEGMDVDTPTLNDLVLPADVSFKPELREIEGRQIPGLTAKAWIRKHKDTYNEDMLYQDYDHAGYEMTTLRMIPYYAWANRGLDEMRVWLPISDRKMEE